MGLYLEVDEFRELHNFLCEKIRIMGMAKKVMATEMVTEMAPVMETALETEAVLAVEADPAAEADLAAVQPAMARSPQAQAATLPRVRELRL